MDVHLPQILMVELKHTLELISRYLSKLITTVVAFFPYSMFCCWSLNLFTEGETMESS